MSFEVQGVGMSLARIGDGASALRVLAAARAEWTRLDVHIDAEFWDRLLDDHVALARRMWGDAAAWQQSPVLPFDDAVAAASAASGTGPITRGGWQSLRACPRRRACPRLECGG